MDWMWGVRKAESNMTSREFGLRNRKESTCHELKWGRLQAWRGSQEQGLGHLTLLDILVEMSNRQLMI